MNQRRLCCSACFIVLASFVPALAIPPDGGTPGNFPGEFVPNAGFLRNVKRLQLIRRAGPNVIIPLAPGKPLSIHGIRSIPVVCVQFKNVAAPFTTKDYESLLFETKGYTMTTYYKAISSGRFSVTGKVFGWYQAPKDDTYYEGDNNGLGGTAIGELLTSALSQADKDADFGQYDNDGADGKPNSGDDDGKVDTIVFIHPEVGGECQNSGQQGNIWSHSWHYSKGLGHTEPFVTDDPVRDSNGDAVAGAFIKIDDYTIQPGLACASTTKAKKIIQVGVFCHEFGHALGLPDLYDRTPHGSPDSAGIGTWCLMAAGSYGGDGDHADRPCHMSAWCKYYLGWANVESLVSALIHNFEPVDDHNTIYRFDVPGTNALEYFLIEFRRRKDWDEYLPANGLAVWHVDERVGDTSPKWPFTAEDKGQNDGRNALVKPPPPLFRTPHQLVALIQADRRMDLERNCNRGDADDLFGGGSFDDDAKGIAGSRAYSGHATDLRVKNIAVVADAATANIETPTAPLAAVAVSEASALPDEFTWQPDSDEDKDVALASSIHQLVAEKGVTALTDKDRENLGAIPTHVLLAQPDGSSKNDFLQAAVDARTTIVTMSTEPHSALGKLLRTVVGQDTDDKQMLVRFAPSGNDIERISGLSLPIGSRSPMDDSTSRVNGAWKTMFDEAKLVPAGTMGKGKDITTLFQQVTTVNERQLPVFDKRLLFHYSSGDLKGVSANLTDQAPKVSGTPDMLPVAEARTAVSRQLGIPSESVRGGKQGVFLIGDNPNLARVAWQFQVPVAPKQRDLDVYLDGPSQKILSIK
jgi:M6 family metalloprotease-like protein